MSHLPPPRKLFLRPRAVQHALQQVSGPRVSHGVARNMHSQSTMHRRVVQILLLFTCCIPSAYAQVQLQIACSQPNALPETCPIVTPEDGLVVLTYRPELAGKAFALALADVLRAEVAKFPLEPAEGEFAWSSDADHHLKIGVAFQHTTFESLGGIDLEQLAIGGSVPRFASIHLSTTATRFSVRYILSRWVHIGALVPFVRTSVQGESSRTVLVTSGTPPVLRPTTLTDTVDKSAAGLGDIVVRGRVNIIATASNETGVQIDVKLPTGDRDELLGLGTRQTRVTFVNSSALGPIAAHVNAGYAFGGNGIASTFPAGVDPRTLITASDEW